VIVTNELSDNFLALGGTSLHVTVEEELTEMIACECADSSSTFRLCETLLQNGQATTVLVLAVDSEVAVKICLEKRLKLCLCW